MPCRPTWPVMRLVGRRCSDVERSCPVFQGPQLVEADTVHVDLAERQS